MPPASSDVNEEGVQDPCDKAAVLCSMTSRVVQVRYRVSWGT